MIRKISKDEQALINTIKSNLPMAAPYINAQVDTAIDIAKKYLSDKNRKYDTGDNIYLHSLRIAVDASKYANVVSEMPMHRYDLIVIALLHDVIEDADCEELRQDLRVFKGNDTIMNGILALTNDDQKISEIGRSKYMSTKFSALSKGNKDIFAIKLMDRIDNLACIKLLNMEEKEQALFASKYLLESLVIYNNLCMNDYIVPNELFTYYNELVTMLISEYIY